MKKINMKEKQVVKQNVEHRYFLLGGYFCLLVSEIFVFTLYCVYQSYFGDSAGGQSQEIDYEKVYIYVPINSSFELDSGDMKDTYFYYYE